MYIGSFSKKLIFMIICTNEVEHRYRAEVNQLNPTQNISSLTLH